MERTLNVKTKIKKKEREEIIETKEKEKRKNRKNDKNKKRKERHLHRIRHETDPQKFSSHKEKVARRRGV